MLEINARKTDGIVILDLSGQLTFGVGHADLWNHASAAACAKPKSVILNLRGVSTIDAAGIGELKLLGALARNAGANMVLVTPETSTLDPSVILQLETEFETFTDEHDAINGFFPNRRIMRYDILAFVTQEVGRNTP